MGNDFKNKGRWAMAKDLHRPTTVRRKNRPFLQELLAGGLLLLLAAPFAAVGSWVIAAGRSVSASQKTYEVKSAADILTITPENPVKFEIEGVSIVIAAGVGNAAPGLAVLTLKVKPGEFVNIAAVGGKAAMRVVNGGEEWVVPTGKSLVATMDLDCALRIGFGNFQSEPQNDCTSRDERPTSTTATDSPTTPRFTSITAVRVLRLPKITLPVSVQMWR